MVNSTHFHYLALFVCHLFNDGPFRTTHILYKNNAFAHEFLTQLNLICPRLIPLYLTDMTQPWVWPWNHHDSPDNGLQLNFFEFNANELRNGANGTASKGFALHQIFAFDESKSLFEWNQAAAFSILYHFSPQSRPLILNCYSENVSVYINRGSNTELNRWPIVFNQTSDFSVMNLFDRTFGEYGRMHSITVQSIEYGFPFSFYQTDYITNFYHLQLNNSCMEIFNGQLFVYNKTTKINYYKELFRSIKGIDGKTSQCQENDHSINLLMIPASLSAKQRAYPNLRFLHPIHLVDFKVVFVYGSNFERKRNIFNASGSVLLTTGVIVAFVVAIAFILWLFRQKFGLSRDEFQLTFIDSLVLIIGGGNLQLDHRLERCFFGTLLVSTFFMMAVFGGNLLECFISVSDAEVRTFNDLANTNAMIIFDNNLGWHAEY